MSWVRRLLSLDLLGSALDLNARQQRVIDYLRAERERERLQYARNTRDLIEHFWIAQEAGLDVREPLLNGLQDLRDEVARLEEHHG